MLLMQLFETELIKWMTKGTERRTLGAFCRQSERTPLRGPFLIHDYVLDSDYCPIELHIENICI